MKKIIIIACVMSLISCYKTGSNYKLSYYTPSIPTARATSYYPTTNILTPEEEECLLEEFKVKTLQRFPDAVEFQIEVTDISDFSSGKTYHCP